MRAHAMPTMQCPTQLTTTTTTARKQYNNPPGSRPPARPSSDRLRRCICALSSRTRPSRGRTRTLVRGLHPTGLGGGRQHVRGGGGHDQHGCHSTNTQKSERSALGSRGARHGRQKMRQRCGQRQSIVTAHHRDKRTPQRTVGCFHEGTVVVAVFRHLRHREAAPVTAARVTGPASRAF